MEDAQSSIERQIAARSRLMDADSIGREYEVPAEVWRRMRPRLARYQG